jgi:hypothetical protein
VRDVDRIIIKGRVDVVMAVVGVDVEEREELELVEKEDDVDDHDSVLGFFRRADSVGESGSGIVVAVVLM